MFRKGIGPFAKMKQPKNTKQKYNYEPPKVNANTSDDLDDVYTELDDFDGFERPINKLLYSSIGRKKSINVIFLMMLNGAKLPGILGLLCAK